MKRYIILTILAAAFISCSDELAMTPAISFFSDKPEISDDTAIFRLATSFMNDSTERMIPVTFGGTAEYGVDYLTSADAFIIGGESPVDSIVITTLRYGTSKDISLALTLPDGIDGGKYLTSGYTIQDNPAYLSFNMNFGILADSTTVSFTVTDKAGKKKAIQKDILISFSLNEEKSTADEGTDFAFADSTHFTIKAGTSNGTVKLTKPDGIPAAGKDKVFLRIDHDEIYGDGQFSEMEILLMENKWSRLHGEWKIDTLVTDSLFMREYWGEGYTGLELLPKFNKFDSMEFDLTKSLFEPSFYSDMEYYFLGDSYFKGGPEMDLNIGKGSPEKVRTFIISNTNRYFSSKTESEDTESYIGLRMVEGEADTLSLYIIDYTSKSFMPELESEGRYAPEKPVAASPGLAIKANFIKKN